MDDCYKQKYNRPKGCISAIQQILASGKIITRIGFYKCPNCSGWHITHNARELNPLTKDKIKKILYDNFNVNFVHLNNNLKIQFDEDGEFEKMAVAIFNAQNGVQ